MIQTFRCLAALLLALCLIPPAWAQLPDPARFGRAMEMGDIRSATRWLDEGLPPDFEADTVGSGMMIAAWDGNIELMQLFLERGANIDYISRIGEQAIALAAWRGHQKAVEWLIERGASLDPPDKTWGALHYAAFAGHRRIADLLIARGAKLDARAPNLSTPLMMAVREGHETIVRALVEAGDEVLLGDPMYATYEGLIAQTGARTVPVPLRPEHGFRMQAADVHPHGAATIEIGSDIVTLRGMRNGIGVDPQQFRQPVGAAGHLVILIVAERALEMPHQLEIAIQPFRPDEFIQEFTGGLALILDRQRAFFAKMLTHRGEVGPDRAAGDTAIAGRGPLAGMHRIKGRHRPPFTRQNHARRQTGKACTHDHDIQFLGQRLPGQRLDRGSFPPIRGAFIGDG